LEHRNSAVFTTGFTDVTLGQRIPGRLALQTPAAAEPIAKFVA
jgi:hypothetical protein